MTILEQLQSAFPDVEGIGDARNIAEALAMISGAGGRGANAIADKVSNPGGDVEGIWDWVAENGINAVNYVSEAIGTKAQYIGSSAFTNRFNLATVSFPNASRIENNAFYSCEKLVDVSIPNASYIGSSAFNGCSSLASVYFPNASYIGSYAFQHCYSLTEVSVPNVSFIGSGAFQNCYSLTTVSFPNASFIEDYAFQHCTMLTSLYLTGDNINTVPELGSSAFENTPIGGYDGATSYPGSVYVPASLYSAFLSAENWSSIASRIVSVPES